MAAARLPAALPALTIQGDVQRNTPESRIQRIDELATLLCSSVFASWRVTLEPLQLEHAIVIHTARTMTLFQFHVKRSLRHLVV